MAAPKPVDPAVIQEGSQSAKLFTWVKGLEAKTNNLLRETSLLKGDSLKKTADLRKEVKALRDEFMDIKHQHESINQKMDLIIKELKKTAGQEEVMVLRKYVDLWNPLTFVTQRDLERMVDAKISALALTGVHLSSDESHSSTHSSGSHSQTKDINNTKSSSTTKKR